MPSDLANCRFCGVEFRNLGLRLTDRRRGFVGEWTMVACSACGCWQRERPFTEAEVAGWYQGYSSHCNAEHSKDARSKHLNHPLRRAARWLRGDPLVADLIKVRKGELVLEVGCGTAAHLKSLVEQGALGAACDLDKSIITILQEQGLTAEKMQSPVSIPFADNAFDRVLAMQVIEHVEEQEAFIDEMLRVLKPGGQCIIGTPNSESWSRKLFGRNWVSGWYTPYHLFVHSTRSLSLLLRNRGFSLDSVVTLTPLSWTMLDSIAAVQTKEYNVEKIVRLRHVKAFQYIFAPLRFLLDTCFSGSCQIILATKHKEH